MAWFQRYLAWFEGEPKWLVLLISVILLVGVTVILERLVKVSGWFLVAGLIACLVFGAGWLFIVLR